MDLNVSICWTLSNNTRRKRYIWLVDNSFYFIFFLFSSLREIKKCNQFTGKSFQIKKDSLNKAQTVDYGHSRWLWLQEIWVIFQFVKASTYTSCSHLCIKLWICELVSGNIKIILCAFIWISVDLISWLFSCDLM